MTDESYGKIDDITNTGASDFSSLVILADRDPNELARQFDKIVRSGVPFNVLGAYSVNSRHCLSIHLQARVKKVKRNKKEL